ncbi:helix-turn-helix transcriptional regulator [Streptomyces sp. SLBN-31]|jgi:transcriptional regulator with XRE-family HTH domain|uniref:helix-turn-helix domain-containing protein n=1 Tax=Streptomyces sp. SLBN-31 TaxID=2768444 RepID=UPI0021B3AB4A|nr:helix-turn-helix transcriptional regulator [Streptomyces sp. SLBN-31]
MVTASRVHRLAELRKRQHTTQVQVAEAMGVTQARVSRIEKASSRQPGRYPRGLRQTLGGKLRIVTDLGDETYVLGRPDPRAQPVPVAEATGNSRSMRKRPSSLPQTMGRASLRWKGNPLRPSSSPVPELVQWPSSVDEPVRRGPLRPR